MITPQPKAGTLAKIIGLHTDLYLKREDIHPYGSHKGRSIPLMIDHYAASGQTYFCISSSGNAALSAIHAIQKLNNKKPSQFFTLHIFVGKHIDPEKLKRLQEAITNPAHITIEQVDSPKQTAFQMDKQGKTRNLRQSTDDTALIGYEVLADELAEIKDLAAVFIPTSSGTTAQGLYNGFKKHGLKPQIHIVQTPKCHPFVDSDLQTKTSLANAIVDNIGYRKEAIQQILSESGGQGWVVSDKEIEKAITQVKETENIDISPNSALSVAGLQLAIKNDWQCNGPVVCLITGK
ncbi:MAG: PLP-dependent lyase/thiolase [Candidatus Magasanikbacteria bacterium]|nr:PLP-dependent lyase/thiolase [Candidatus Magasanikbacteria bacterium]